MAQYPTWTRADGRVYPVQKFSSILKVWAMQSAKQLHDAFQTQKLWNDTKANSVWVRQAANGPLKPGQKTKRNGARRPGMFGQWSWYDESKLREKLDKGIPGRITTGKGQYWFSTGYSAKVSDVKVVNATMEDAEIDFHTTAGALFAEAGVGLNGKRAVRGARASKGRKRIKVDRQARFLHDKRYVGNWEPSQGKTHRPGPKQQVWYLKRRLKWAANAIYCRDLAIYLGRTMEEAWQKVGKITVWTGAADGSFEIKPVNGNTQ